MRKSLCFLTVIFCLVSFIIVGLASYAFAEATINLKFAHWAPPLTVFSEEVYAPWAQEVEKNTGGRVKITLFPGGAMGAPQDHYNLLTSGMCDIAMVDTSFTGGVFPLTTVMNLPLLFSSAKSAAASYYELIAKDLADTEYKNIKVLFTGSAAPQCLFSNKPVKKIEDIKGMRIAISSEMGIKALESLGAKAIFMPPPEIYTGLERGIIDGATQCWDAAASFKYYEVSKYRTFTDFGVTPHLIMMNLDSWKKLPDDIKKIFEDTSGLKRSMFSGDALDRTNKKILEQVILPYDKSKGNPGVYYLTDEDMKIIRDKMVSVYEYFIKQNEAKGLPSKKVFEDLVEIAKKYN